MRIQIKNTAKGEFSFPGGPHLGVSGTAWLSESDVVRLGAAGIQIGQLVAANKLKVVATEADDLETQFVKQLIVQAPNGSLWQVNVSNAGTLSASSYTAVAPHNTLGL